MNDRVTEPTTALASRLSRRDALQTYARPAIALVGVGAVKGMGTSGAVQVSHPNAGRGNGPEPSGSIPDVDPGNSAGRNQGGDGVVPSPGNGAAGSKNGSKKK